MAHAYQSAYSFRERGNQVSIKYEGYYQSNLFVNFNWFQMTQSQDAFWKKLFSSALSQFMVAVTEAS